jgi:hypothetical protein
VRSYEVILNVVTFSKITANESGVPLWAAIVGQ